MLISILNGSPKTRKSTSELLINYLQHELKEQSTQVFHISGNIDKKQIDKLKISDVVVFVFPLYVDSIPSHVLRGLRKLEKEKIGDSGARIFCVINNGFFEGTQNYIAIQQMKLWCQAVQLCWGQALGIGAGEMLPFIKDIPLGHGPNISLGKAIKEFTKNILNSSAGKDIFVTVNYPKFLWRIQSSILVWLPRAKANGLKISDLFRKMDMSNIVR